MQKSTILFLISVLFLVSCATKNSVGKDYVKVAADKTIYDAPYFADTQTDYVYKTNISVHGKEFSGLFIIKKITETMHRVAFTTEFGNKLLDFEISETDFKINSIVSELDRKMLINTLKADFRLLLRNKFLVTEQLANENSTVYKSQDGKGFNYVFLAKNEGKLYRIVYISKRTDKIIIDMDSDDGILAQNINIEHKNINLKINLTYLRP
jgi:hypothetical protein